MGEAIVDVKNTNDLGESSTQVQKLAHQIIEQHEEVKKVKGILEQWVNPNKDALVAQVIDRGNELVKIIESLESFGNVGVQTANLLNETDAAVAKAISQNA